MTQSRWLPFVLLTCSNVFMTFAWYGHLKFKNRPLWEVVVVSWGIAFFEYLLQVPANRWGSNVYAPAQLKVAQEIITLTVFSVFAVLYLGMAIKWNHIAAFACIVGAACFIFLPKGSATLEHQPAPETPAFQPKLAEAAFDQLWNAFDQKYAMFAIRPEVDWAKLREQYRPQALASKSASEFAQVCAEMLRPLRDLHVWLTLAGERVPVYDRPRPANANPLAYSSILGPLHRNGRVAWALALNRTGFITIAGWDDDNIPAHCAEALEQMRDTRGLIVDVRLNGGGSDGLAEKFAARFVERNFTYAYSQFRNGPGHTDLTEKTPRVIEPGGPWRYERPVILLIGQKCLSSDESFVGMMTGDPLVTTMGDHTGGSSGNPQIINLPFDMTVSVPQWIDYLLDGTVLDEHGFQPQIPFTPGPGAFEGDRDDLLSAALERLGQAPLPSQPIAGPATAPALKSPEIVELKPPNGARDVDPALAELRVTFNVPMGGGMSWCGGGPDFPEMVEGAQAHWTTDGKTCVLPVKLKPGWDYKLGLNSVSFRNFTSAEGLPLAPVEYNFTTRQP